jgi:hypothetical protein
MFNDWSTGCSIGVVLPALIGLAVGFLGGSYPAGATNVDYARYYASHPAHHTTTPELPRGVFLAQLFTIFGLFKGSCPGVFIKHQLFVLAPFAGGISSALWLLLNYQRQSSIDAERQARADRFISDANADVPPPVPDVLPQWFRIWNAANIGFFFAFMAPPGLAFLRQLSGSMRSVFHS